MLSNQITADIVDKMRGVFGDKLLSVALFGSVARGDDTPASDVDIALFLRGPMEEPEMNAMLSRFTDMDLKYDRFFSPIDIQQKKYDEWVDVLPFYRNIREEGIVLWKAS